MKQEGACVNISLVSKCFSSTCNYLFFTLSSVTYRTSLSFLFLLFDFLSISVCSNTIDSSETRNKIPFLDFLHSRCIHFSVDWIPSLRSPWRFWPFWPWACFSPLIWKSIAARSQSARPKQLCKSKKKSADERTKILISGSTWRTSRRTERRMIWVSYNSIWTWVRHRRIPRHAE